MITALVILFLIFHVVHVLREKSANIRKSRRGMLVTTAEKGSSRPRAPFSPIARQEDQEDSIMQARKAYRELDRRFQRGVISETDFSRELADILDAMHRGHIRQSA